jgi:hypothetical protein
MRNSLALLGIPDLPIRAFRHIGDRKIQPQGGGTGIPIVDDVLDEGQRLIDKTSDALAKVDDTVNKVVPGGWTTVVSLAAPPLAPYVQAANVIDKGGNLEDAAKAYVISQIGGEIGGNVGAETGSGFAGNVAGSTASGVLSGKPLDQSLTSGVVSGGLSSGANAISDAGLADFSQKNAQTSYENAPSPTEQDVLAADPSIKMDFPLSTPPSTTGSGYYDETSGVFVPSDTGVVQAPLTDTSGTNLDSVKENADTTGLSNTQSPLDTGSVLPPPSNVAPEAYDPLTKKEIKAGLTVAANNLLNQPSGGTSGAGQSPAPTSLSQQVYKDPILSSEAQYLGPRDSTSQNIVGDPAKLQELQQLYASLDPRLKEELQARGISPVETTDNTNPLNSAMYNTRLVAQGGTIKSYAGGSSVTDSSDQSVFNPTITKASPNMLPPAPVIQMPSRLGALRHIFSGIGSRQPHLASGGLPSKYTEAAPKGHNPEFVTGLTGYYAQGKGTGQSDDIPAMLHDGDYVADADLVAALGDGSSKAGAEALEKFRRQIPHQQSAEGGAIVPAKIADGEYVFPASFVTAIGKGDNKAGAKLLDAMRQEIRAHKRSAPTSKIPPKAKSPLDYLKMVKG